MNNNIISILNDERRLKSYIRDLYYRDKPLVNAMISAYDLKIPFDIMNEGCQKHSITAFEKRLVAEYGIKDEVAYCAIDEWVGLVTDEFKSDCWYCIDDGVISKVDDKDIGYLLLIDDRGDLSRSNFIVLDRFDDDVKDCIKRIIDEYGNDIRNIFYHKYGLDNCIRYSKDDFESRYRGTSYYLCGSDEKSKLLTECEEAIHGFVNSIRPGHCMFAEREIKGYLYGSLKDTISEYIYTLPNNYKNKPEQVIPFFGISSNYYLFNDKKKISDDISIVSVSINNEILDEEILLERIQSACDTDKIRFSHFKHDILELMIKRLNLEGVYTWRDWCIREYKDETIQDALEDVWRDKIQFTNIEKICFHSEEGFYYSIYEDFEELLRICLNGTIDEIEVRYNKVKTKYKCKNIDVRESITWITEDMCDYLVSNGIFIKDLMCRIVDNTELYEWLLKRGIFNIDLLKKNEKKLRKILRDNTGFTDSFDRAFDKKLIFFKTESELPVEFLSKDKVTSNKSINDYVKKMLKEFISFYYE